MGRLVDVVPIASLADVRAGAARDLTDGRRATTDDLGDLVVSERESLVEHENRPFQRAERLQYHEHGERGCLRTGLGGLGVQWFGQPEPGVGLSIAPGAIEPGQ